jgi:hypothetical protein
MINLLITPILAFLSAIISRLGNWFIVAYLSGALRSLVINLALFGTLTALITGLIIEANSMVLQAIQNMSPISQMMLAPIAAMMPPSLSVCASMIASVYVMGMIYNLAKEIAKLKAKAAERAAGFLKA